ncbi:DNA methyltransferase [bacterium]|nr:DNA methyltransferase [bacterium]
MQSSQFINDSSIKSENSLIGKRGPFSSLNNKLNFDDKRFHDWYRFVLSYPAHLVKKYIQEFCNDGNDIVLDPFCGTGTTLVEAKLNGVVSVGIEANPFAHFASSTKINWKISSIELLQCANEIANLVRYELSQSGIDDNDPTTLKKGFHPRVLEPELEKIILKNSISPIPLHKTLLLLDKINSYSKKDFYPHLLLALAKSTVFKASNLKFGPEVGLGKIKENVPVVEPWLGEVNSIADDISSISGSNHKESNAYLGDSRQASALIKPKSISAIITSPPYPNEKDYTRTTRLESVLLGFIKSKEELRQFKKTLIRSNTRGVYKGDDDHQWIENHPEIKNIADQIEARRIELKKTSGFERLYSKVTLLYFGGMAKHLKELHPILKPGARLAYVVGDQASYLRIMIRTGEILADIAQRLGYRVDRIDLFRTRFATATGEQLREEVVILTWPGNKL